MSIHAIKNAVISRFSSARLFRSQHTFAGASIDTWFERTYRMYNSIHHPDEIAKEQRRSGMILSDLGYYPFARLKVDAARIYVDGTYSNAVEAPFTLEPTRNPDLNDDQKGEVSIRVARLMSKQLEQTGLNFDDVWSTRQKKTTDPQIDKWLKSQVEKARTTYNDDALEVAKEACDYRAGYMSDQLDFGGWIEAWPIITHNLMAEPYTAMCARETKAITTTKWKGRKVERIIKTAPHFRAIDPRNLYLSPDATSAQDGSGVTEMTKRTRSDLIGMLKSEDDTICREGVFAAIAKIKEDGTENDWLQHKAVQLGTYETHSLVHQGLFSGKELAGAGKTGLRETEYYNVTVEVCQDELIRFEVLPYEHNLRNYYTAQHTKTSSCYAGESILTKLYTIQNELNIAMVLRDRNYYMSSGPTIITHAGYFNRPQDLVMLPYAQNMAANDRQNANKGIEQITIEPHYTTQDAHIEWLKRQGDEISGVVSGLSGLARSGVTRTTLGGAVLDQTAGERTMNACVLNLDRTIIQPMIEHLDADNMQWDEIPKHYMRGDVIVRGKGINGLREIELRGRLAAEALPIAMQANQAGQVPDELLQGAYKQYFDSKGVNSSSIQSNASRREMQSANLVPPQKSDGRTYNPQQPMTGVA